MTICGIKGCGTKSCRKRNIPLEVSFHCVPKVVYNQGDEARKLTEERRRLWKEAIGRKDVTTEEQWNRILICSKHFVDGKPAYVNFRNSPSWLPTLYLVPDCSSTASSLVVKCSSTASSRIVKCSSTASSRRVKNHRPHCCVHRCAVKTCKLPTLSFHRFPKDENLKQRWLVKIRRKEGPRFQVHMWKTICSKHFLPEDYLPSSLKEGKQKRLRPDAVPSLFQWNHYQRPKEKKRRAVCHPLSQANVNTNQSEIMGAEPSSVDGKTAAVITLSQTKKQDEESLKPSSNCKKTDKYLLLAKLLLAPVVQRSERDFSKIPLPTKRLEENTYTDAASSVPSEQASVSNQQYTIVSMDDSLKPFSITYPAGPSQEPISLHRNENNTSVSRQHQIWTTTCDQQPTYFHCTSEVKQDVVNDQEEYTEQLLTYAVKKEAKTEFLLPHCCPHQRTVKGKGKSSCEVRLLEPKCEPQSLSTWEYSLTDSQDHHINVINPVCIKNETQDLETLSHIEPVTQVGSHGPGINTRVEILKPQREEVPLLNLLHPDSIIKEKDYETSWNAERAALTTLWSFESKMETEIYPTGLYYNLHGTLDNVNEVYCASDASNQCTNMSA